jgi:hypothetical protein
MSGSIFDNRGATGGMSYIVSDIQHNGATPDGVLGAFRRGLGEFLGMSPGDALNILDLQLKQPRWKYVCLAILYLDALHKKVSLADWVWERLAVSVIDAYEPRTPDERDLIRLAKLLYLAGMENPDAIEQLMQMRIQNGILDPARFYQLALLQILKGIAIELI